MTMRAFRKTCVRGSVGVGAGASGSRVVVTHFLSRSSQDLRVLVAAADPGARQPDLATPRKLRRRSSRATMIIHSQSIP
jgi:hypothetical protein